ncbi:MAG: glutamine amidotransferase [Candidatus Saccharimonadales bacterium]
MTAKTLRILQLYPRNMNIYGDTGNALVLMRRAKWHGYIPELISYDMGDAFPKNVDMIIGGGGQDSGQTVIQADLLTIGDTLKTLADGGTPMLMICGLYQLFGRFFKTSDGRTIQGIGILDAETQAGPERLIGNIVTHSEQFGDIIGYENHSGQTSLGEQAQPLATIIKGAGNNGQDDTEGARYNNVLGSYLHGSLLPKNPAIADFLIEQAAVNKYGEFTPTVIDDRFAKLAREHTLKRPR